MVPSETASKIHVLSTAHKITGGGTALVSGETKKLTCRCSSVYFRQGTQRPLFVQEGFSLDFIIKEVRILAAFVSTQPVSAWNS